MKNIIFILSIITFILLSTACQEEYVYVEHTREVIHVFTDFTVEQEQFVDQNDNPYITVYIYQMKPEKTLIGQFDMPPTMILRVEKKDIEGGYQIAFYYEANATEGFQIGEDDLQEMVTLFHGENGKNAVVNYGISDECGEDRGLWFLAYTEGQPAPEAITICAPKGDPGYNGEDAINIYPRSVKLYDRNGEQIGFRFEVWRDIDRSGGISDGDELHVNETVWFVGINVTSTTDEEGVTVITKYLNNGVWEEETVFYPHADDGMSVSFETYAYGDSARLHRFYYDLELPRGVYNEGDSLLDEYVVQLLIPNEDKGKSSNYDIFWNFNQGNTHDMIKEGAEFLNMSSSDRAVHGLYNNATEGYFITPTLPPFDDAYRLTFQYASACTCKLTIYIEQQGRWRFLAAMNVQPFQNYDKYDFNTYRYFGIRLSPDRKHVDRFKFMITEASTNNESARVECGRNDPKTQFRIDNVTILMDDVGSSN